MRRFEVGVYYSAAAVIIPEALPLAHRSCKARLSLLLMDDERLRKALSFAQQATEKDREGDYELAFDLYKRCLEHWHLASKYQSNPLLKERLYQKMEPYVTRAETIKQYLSSQKPQPVASGGSTPATTASVAAARAPAVGSPASSHPPNEPAADGKLLEQLASTVVSDRPQLRWDDIAGLETAKDALQEAVTLPTRFPHLFVGERRPWKGILLYGPPGTGKTHLARACAAESDATFMSVSSADLVSKWQGESEKLVRGLFELARQRSPTVIFIDEVDSLCGARNDREGESSRRIKTEFLVQMDGVSQQNGGSSHPQDAAASGTGLAHRATRLLVLGATNEPWALDAAIRRRFERRIFIPLPHTAARRQMLRQYIGKTPHSLTEADLHQLAVATDGYSGADISVLVRDALLEPVRRCRIATHFKHAVLHGQLFWTPCAPSDPDPTKEERQLMSIPGAQLMPPEVSMRDFLAVLEQSKPSVSREELERHAEWTKRFGIECQ